MKKIILSGLAVAAFAAQIAAVAPAAAAQPTTTTHSVPVVAAFDGVVDLPALNSQFTSMTINVKDGEANFGPAADNAWTSYTDGVVNTGWKLESGIWGDETLPGHGPLLLEGTQVGTVIYRLDGGAWKPLREPITIDPAGDGTHKVQVAYNDRPGSYDDNFGSLSLTVVRSKA